MKRNFLIALFAAIAMTGWAKEKIIVWNIPVQKLTH